MYEQFFLEERALAAAWLLGCGPWSGLSTRPLLAMGGWVSGVTRHEFWMGVGRWVGTHLLTKSNGFRVWVMGIWFWVYERLKFNFFPLTKQLCSAKSSPQEGLELLGQSREKFALLVVVVVQKFANLAPRWGNFRTHPATHPQVCKDGYRVGVTHRNPLVGWVENLPTHPSKSGTHPPNGCG